MCYSGKCLNEGFSGDCNLSRAAMEEYHHQLEKSEPCPHLHVTIHRRLYAMETRYEPAEYEYKAQCDDCGEWMETEEIPEGAEEKDA